jgi:hypothetical protein
MEYPASLDNRYPVKSASGASLVIIPVLYYKQYTGTVEQAAKKGRIIIQRIPYV